MKTLITVILIMLFISRVSFAQDTLFIYKGGVLVSMRAVADIDSITFNKSDMIVTDIEGNIYKTIKIGSQIWMAENLKTRQYNDSTYIPLVIAGIKWKDLSTPGYCWFENDSATYSTDYGALYNWYTVNSGKLCPTGWHVPTDEEWTVLTDYLGGKGIAGGKLKEAGLAHWAVPNQGATNESGFTGLPGGYRGGGATFDQVGFNGYWWSSTELYTGIALSRGLDRDYNNVGGDTAEMPWGFSVRCVRN
jgi:uncharacterized protein (TIGR02145 family)